MRALPIREDPPRPLPPRRRDATKLFPVQDAFVRQEMRCSSSGLSTGDCASIPGLEAPRCFWHRETRVVPRPPRVVLRTPRYGFSTLRRLRLLKPRMTLRSERFRTRNARPLRAERDFARLHPKARPPFTASPNHPFEWLRLGEGLLWAKPPIDICNETTTYEHYPRGRSAPASNHVPLARPMIP